MSTEEKLKEENDRLKAALQQWKGNHSIVIEDRDTLLLALVKLKDENERLRAASFVTAVPVEQYERLRKAGDAMAEALKDGGIIVSGYILADEWFKAKHLTAKEGKQS